MRWLPTLVVLLGSLLASGPRSASALDPTRPLLDFSLQSWTIDQGLPHDAVISLAQTDDGYLWAGTWDGLVRFNGAEFRHFDADNTPALRDDGTLALFAGRGNSLWVGTHRGGLARLRDGRWENLRSERDGGFSHVLAVLEDNSGTLWVGTEERGFFSYRDGEFNRFNSGNGLPSNTVSALLETRHGRLFVGTSRGLSERIDGRFVPLGPTGVGAPQISAIREDRQGRVLIASDQGLERLSFRGAALQQREKLYAEPVTQLLIDRFGSIWFSSLERGIVRLAAGRIDSFSVADGLPNTRVSALLEDSDGDIWIGTNGGLARLQDKAFLSVTRRRGLTDDYVRAISEAADGTLWIGTSAGLNQLQEGRVTPFETLAGLGGNSVLALASMAPNTLWVGTYNHGAAQFDGRRALPIDRTSGLPGNQVRAILRARDGSTYFGTDRGVARERNGRFELLPTELLPGTFVLALHETPDGALWVGSSNGVGVIRSGQARVYREPDGIGAQNVFSFLTDTDGTLWLGTDSGLYRFQDERFARIDRARGLPENTVFTVLDDALGHLWMSSNHGVFRIDKSSANAVADGIQDKLVAFVFGRGDGMASSQCNGGSQPAALKLRDGRLAFATSRGVDDRH
jgi:ligand-binding sensor domain-containing protein